MLFGFWGWVWLRRGLWLWCGSGLGFRFGSGLGFRFGGGLGFRLRLGNVELFDFLDFGLGNLRFLRCGCGRGLGLGLRRRLYHIKNYGRLGLFVRL